MNHVVDRARMIKVKSAQQLARQQQSAPSGMTIITWQRTIRRDALVEVVSERMIQPSSYVHWFIRLTSPQLSYTLQKSDCVKCSEESEPPWGIDKMKVHHANRSLAVDRTRLLRPVLVPVTDSNGSTRVD